MLTYKKPYFRVIKIRNSYFALFIPSKYFRNGKNTKFLTIISCLKTTKKSADKSKFPKSTKRSIFPKKKAKIGKQKNRKKREGMIFLKRNFKSKIFIRNNDI